MHAMILAAGRGERMRPLTDNRPKVLLEAAHKPLLAWHLENLQRAGFRQVVINHAWLGDQIERAIGNGDRFGLRIVYSAEQSALETAGGIATALPLIGNAPFMVVNGDVFTDLEFSTLVPHLQALTSGTSLAHLVLVDNPAHHPNGDFALDGERVDAELTPRLTFSGVGLYRPELFAGIRQRQRGQLAPLLRAAMAQQRVTGQRYTGCWFDIGTPERLDTLNRMLASR